MCVIRPLDQTPLGAAREMGLEIQRILGSLPPQSVCSEGKSVQVRARSPGKAPGGPSTWTMNSKSPFRVSQPSGTPPSLRKSGIPTQLSALQKDKAVVESARSALPGPYGTLAGPLEKAEIRG